MNKKQGFTLMELIVVIAIISLLASIVLSQLGSAKQKGSDSGKIRTLAEVRNALNVYFNDSNGGNGTYPTTANLTTKLVPKYIASINPNIKYFSDGKAYHLAIILSSSNKVLASDSDSSLSFPGLSANCTNAGVTDLCYDIAQ